jgi:hypothetical protein
MLFIVAVATLGLVACNKSEVALDNIPPIQKAPKTNEVLDQVSQIICGISDNTAAMQQILSAVNQNLLFGMDEYVYVRDVLFPNESKIFDKSVDISTLSELLRTAFGVEPNLDLKGNMENPLVNFVVTNEIQIYFPYSETWDKTTKPFIVPVEIENEKGDENVIAYTKGQSGVEKFVIPKVTEKYLQENHVLAVMESSVPYENLPAFNQGIFEKDGTIWMVRIPKEIKFGPLHLDGNDDNTIAWYDSTQYIYRIYLDNLSFHELDDGIIWTRPEVKFQALTAVINPNDTNVVKSAVHSREFKKREIANGKEIERSYLINADWKPSTANTSLTIAVWEDDGGDSKDYPIDLSIPNKFTLKTTISIKNKDDFQGQLPAMERDVFFITAKIPFGGNGLTSDDFAYYWCGAAKFALKYEIISRN